MASQIGFLLVFLGRNWAEALDAGLRPLGLDRRLLGVLSLVEAKPGRTQQQLVAEVHIDPSTMVAIVDELERSGLAERRAHPRDRRKREVHLTAKGRRTYARAREAVERLHSQLLAPLREEEREMLRSLLRRMVGFAV